MYTNTSERSQTQLLWMSTAIAFVAVTWGVLAVSESLSTRFNLVIYLVTNTLVFIDAIDFLIRFGLMGFGSGSNWVPSSLKRHWTDSFREERKPLSLYQKRLHMRPWAIVVSVYNVESALVEFMGTVDYLRERIWVIDDGSGDGTCDFLRSTGWRCLRSDRNIKKPGAIARLVDELPAEIETIMVIDPDIEIPSRDLLGLATIEEIVFDFQNSELAAICPRIAVQADSFMSKFQMMEYTLAFFGRRSMGHTCLTSGISLYRRPIFSQMLERHSKSVYAEDMENSIRLLGMGYKVGSEYRLVIQTEGKRTIGEWFSQRIGWSYGFIKVYVQRFRDVRVISRRSLMGFYQYIAYMGVASLGLQPLKTISLIFIALSFSRGTLYLLGVDVGENLALFEPSYFLAVFTKYLIFMLITCFMVVPRNERGAVLPILPLYLIYALLLTAATTVGYLNWLTLRLFGRRVVKDHYDDSEELRFNKRRGVLSAWGI